MLCPGVGVEIETGLSSPVLTAGPCWPGALPVAPRGPLDFLGLPGYFLALAKCSAISGGVLLEPSSPYLLLFLLPRVESMSLADRGNPGNITSRLMEKEKARDCLTPMG